VYVSEYVFIVVVVLQEKCILRTRPVLHEAVAAAVSSAAGAIVVADLGCSSGPNTLLVVSEVLGAVADCREDVTTMMQPQPPVQHVQFFLNDLPGNDFNLVFRSLELFKKVAAAKDKGDSLPPYYVAGLPGSFYTRLFPDRCVHLFHSSYCLMWRSKARTAQI
jgi:jasmonate O-methyltransferase